MLWLIFSIIAGLTFGLVDLAGKFIVDKEIHNSFLASGVTGLGIFSIFIVTSLVMGNIGLSNIVLPSIMAGLFYSVSMFFYYSGISKEEVSRFSMTLSLTTVFVVLLAFVLLGESFPFVVYVGIGMTILGSLLISLEDPLKSLSRFESIAGLLLAVMATLFFAFREISFKFAFNQTVFWNGVFWAGLSGLLFSALLTMVDLRGVSRNNTKGLRNLFLVGVLSGSGFILFAKAISLGPVSLASAVLKVKALMIFSGSIALTKFHPEIIDEKWDRYTFLQKFAASVVIIIGVLLIQLFS